MRAQKKTKLSFLKNPFNKVIETKIRLSLKFKKTMVKFKAKIKLRIHYFTLFHPIKMAQT